MIAFGLSIVTLMSLAFAAPVGERGNPRVTSPPTAPAAPGLASATPGATVSPARIGASSREAAAAALLAAWRRADRVAAAGVAHDDAVDGLMSQPYDPAARFGGCGTDTGGFVRCILRTPAEAIVLTPEHDGFGRWYIRYIEIEPPGYTVDPI